LLHHPHTITVAPEGWYHPRNAVNETKKGKKGKKEGSGIKGIKWKCNETWSSSVMSIVLMRECAKRHAKTELK
jgi:hypothetical protein